MSSVDNIKKQILLDAEKKALDILNSAKEEVKNIKEEAHNEAIVKHEHIVKKALIEEKAQIERLKIKAGLDKRKKLLSAKQTSINTAFEKTVEKIKSMDNKEYEKLLFSLIEESVKNNASDKYILSFNKEDEKRLSDSFIKDIKNITKSKIGFEFNETKIETGFILKMEHIEINNSIKSILNYKREKIEKDVYSALFSKD